ncbi:conserved domain protein [Actinomyces sp. oral taxon 175 str. F0384]|nr:conserved domain protein [Actinomyces sp. oral taxon 175 str. F0384]
MRAAVLIPNGACRGLRFAPRTYFSSKRRVSAPSHLGDSAVLVAKVRSRSTSSRGLATGARG